MSSFCFYRTEPLSKLKTWPTENPDHVTENPDHVTETLCRGLHTPGEIGPKQGSLRLQLKATTRHIDSILHFLSIAKTHVLTTGLIFSKH